MNIYDVIVRPVVTEKTEILKADEGQYTFEVNRRANKIEIKHAVETIYDVSVVSVNVLNMPAKINRMRGRRRVTRIPTWKKAVVTLAPGQRIEALEA
ncbi:MAG: 50S ribosomal protein L23 [Anaerolineae bacterium]|nr:50S ribosomal protein L23 [Anaerolineae bacterium]